MNIIGIGSLGFETFEQKPSTIQPPSLSDVKTLWPLYSLATSGKPWKEILSAVVKGPGFRAQFAALTRFVVAINTMLDNPQQAAEIVQEVTSL